MYHSLIGKPSLRVVLVMGLLIGLCSLLLLAACGAEEAAKGAAGGEHKKRTSGGTAPKGASQEHNKSKSAGPLWLPSEASLAACGGGNSAKGGTAPNKSTRSFAGPASTDGLIVFRRNVDSEGIPNLPYTSCKSAIFTMYPNGSHIRQITHPPEGDFSAPKGLSDYSPAWSPDGTKVAFNRRCRLWHCHENQIMVVDVNTGDTRKVTHCNPHNCLPGEFEPAFSPDGKSIAFRGITGSEDESSRVEGIYIVGLDGSDPHQVTNVQKRGALEFEDFGPAFSPDGKMLVFERSRLEDDQTAVFVQSLDSPGSPEDARQITPWNMNCGDDPEFSPKGDWVLFRCDDEGRYSDLYWVHPDGTGLEQLTNDQPDDVDYVGSSFSPEFDDEGWGDIVAARYPAYGAEGNSDVFRMHIDHGVVQETVNLTKSQTLDDAPSWGTYPPSARQ
jgi:Tol biopolymer transport system component